jgi:predicted nucleic acid-binding protein
MKGKVFLDSNLRNIVSDLQGPFSITSATVSHAMEINSRHGYSYWDSPNIFA